MRYKLAIVGGGVVGAGLAAALHAFDGAIALIDARVPSNADPRLFALNYGSCEFLKNVGIWPAIATQAAPIHQVHVSKQGRFGAVRLTREEVSLPTLGHVIPAYIIEEALNTRLAAQANVSVLRPAELQSMTIESKGVLLKLTTPQGEQSIQADKVIGADGTESKVRQLLNLPTKRFDYAQSAIVTRTTLSRPHQQIAYERFNDHGAIAMLPLTDLECATIWTAEQEQIDRLMLLSDGEFLAQLQASFGYRLGRLQAISRRHVFPLRMLQTEQPPTERVKLLGNSLHTLHPIAAQGFNLALYEVADLVASGWVEGAETQVTEVKRQSTFTSTLSHQLAKLFSSSTPFPSALLQLGMIGLDLTRPAKKKLLTQLLGRAAGVPHLLLSKQEL